MLILVILFIISACHIFLFVTFLKCQMEEHTVAFQSIAYTQLFSCFRDAFVC